MTSAAKRRVACLLVTRRAMRGYEDLPTAEKIELLLAVAEVLPKAESDAAKQTAFSLQAAENRQLAFAEMLTGT